MDRWIGRATSALLLVSVALLVMTIVALPGIARRELERRLHGAAAARGLVLTYEALELGADFNATLRGVSVWSERDALTASTDLVRVHVSPVAALFGTTLDTVRSVETGDLRLVSALDESIDALVRRLATAPGRGSAAGANAGGSRRRKDELESVAHRLFSGRTFHVTIETARTQADLRFEVDIAARHLRADATLGPGAVAALPTLERVEGDGTILDFDGLKRAIHGDGQPEAFVRGRIHVSPPLAGRRVIAAGQGAAFELNVGGVDEAAWDGHALTIAPIDVALRSDEGESVEGTLTAVRLVLAGETDADLDIPRIDLVGARGTLVSDRLPAELGRNAGADRITLHLGEALRDALVLRSRCPECLRAALGSPRDLVRAVSAVGLTGEAHGHAFGLARALLLRTGQGEGGDLVVSATGEFGPLGSQSDAWMDARVTLTSSGRPRNASVALTGVGSRLDPTGVTRVLAIPESSRADLFLDVDFETGDRVTATGQVAVRALELSHWRIAKGPVGPIEGRADLAFAWDRRAGTASARVTNARIGNATGSVSLDLEKLQGTPRFQVSVTVPDQDCQSLADAVPRALLETTGRLDVTGRATLEARLDVDLEDPENLTFETRGSLSDCTIASLGMSVDGKLASLSRRFKFEPVVNGEPVGAKVGPGTRNWVSMRKIPRFIVEAAMGTEDGGFYKHGGLKESLIRGALKLNFKHRRYVYGGSTITQQLVKNLFLTRTKNIARKFEEAVIATAVERSLSKERILELYLNCIEYGPKIWGIKKAARAYFGKEVEDLAAAEGLFLMAIKPYPVHAYYVARDGQWNERWVERMRGVFEKMVRRGYVSREEMDAAAPLYKPEFTGLRFARRL
ncbi:MAG: transglycosylase domain-containing protein [Myxococcales bacterium]|nr:transglycosylase domain-containing protein [Myxococcales bacterium]